MVRSISETEISEIVFDLSMFGLKPFRSNDKIKLHKLLTKLNKSIIFD